MAEEKSVFSAADAAAGYYYQARLALAESLKLAYGDSGVEVAIERFDDVSFEKDGSPLELLQTKHHVNAAANLTDTSADLWKTIRVWSEATKEDPSLPGRTRLALVTTAQAPDNSAASFLRPATTSTVRDSNKALALLEEAAKSSKSQTLAPAFIVFGSLAPEMRVALLEAIEVIDRAPVLVDLGPIIEDRLKLIAPRGKTSAARELLEGWWWPRVCKALLADKGVIPILELEAKLDDIREMMKRDALPIDMEHVEPEAAELQKLDEMIFVRQLRHVGTGEPRIQYAKRDYYRAFTQRSRWTRESLLFDGEVGAFEKTLVEEWEPRFYGMCDGLSKDADSSGLQQAGQSLYHWVETEARFPFRTITAKFLSVGSFHMLADALRLGWHRDFKSLLSIGKDDTDDK